MSGRIIAGIVGFVVLVLLVQNYVLDDDEGPETLGRSGAAPTATLPAQTPEAISLGQAQSGNGSTANGGGNGGNGGGTYVVQSGDTLGTIADSLNIASDAQPAWIAQVLELNGIADARLLQAGQELIIPGGGGNDASEAPAEGPAPEATTAAPAPSGEGGTYIVVSGDTPFGIAEKFCVEGPEAWVNDLLALNGIDPSALAVGAELELPAGTPPQCVE